MARGWRYDARVDEVLDESDLLYVAVDGSKGRHVTPAVAGPVCPVPPASPPSGPATG